jgi:hypothetical protein
MSERLAKPDEVDTLSDEFIGVGTGWGAYKDAQVLPSVHSLAHPVHTLPNKPHSFVHQVQLQFY